MSDFKQIRKLNMYFEINIKCIDIVLSLRGFCVILANKLIKVWAPILVRPRSGCRSQKQPVLSPDGDKPNSSPLTFPL